MKKLVSVLIVLSLVLTLSVCAFAATKDPIVSPVAPTQVTVTVVKAIGTIGQETISKTTTVDAGTEAIAEEDTTYGAFDSFKYYKVDDNGKAYTDKSGKFVEAVLGEDYEIVSGSGNGSPTTIRVLNDIIICGNYGGKTTNPNTGEDIREESPQTGVNDLSAEMIICAVLLAGAAFVFGAKKQLSK